MSYLGRVPTIDNKSITDSVEAGFKRALSEALIPDPTSGEMVFDEEKIDKILEEKRNYLPDQPLLLPLPTSQGVIADRSERDVYSGSSKAAEFITHHETFSGGGAFPLLALGLVAYLSSQ